MNKLQNPSKAHKVLMADISNPRVNLLHSQVFGYHIWYFKIPQHRDPISASTCSLSVSGDDKALEAFSRKPY